MSEFKGAPIDAFNKEFCVLCSNRECTRSWGNASVFDSRVKNWRAILFENVLRIDDASLTNLKFEPIDSTHLPDVNTQPFETIPAPALFDDARAHDTDRAPPISDPVPTPDLALALEPQPHTTDAVNTPFDQPVMLGEKPKAEEKAEPGCVFVFEDE